MAEFFLPSMVLMEYTKNLIRILMWSLFLITRSTFRVFSSKVMQFQLKNGNLLNSDGLSEFICFLKSQNLDPYPPNKMAYISDILQLALDFFYFMFSNSSWISSVCVPIGSTEFSVFSNSFSLFGIRLKMCKLYKSFVSYKNAD